MVNQLGQPGNVPREVALKGRVAPSGSPTATALTYKRAVGDPIDSRRTAFAPDSGTLGIPRDQMPQVAAEHRGAMANFLNARGMQVGEADVLPGSLKPSQAEFNPAKVAKAGAIREAGDANPRRILVSSDNRVIDGHHQWLDRLANDPKTPMPALRINAPARDILSQLHEFPSAGMEKAPDLDASPAERPLTRGAQEALGAIGKWQDYLDRGSKLNVAQERILTGEQAKLSRELGAKTTAPLDLSARAMRARENIAKLEAVQAKNGKLFPEQQGSLDGWRNVLAQEAGKPGPGREPASLAAAAPEDMPFDPDEAPSHAAASSPATPDPMRQPLAWARGKLAELRTGAAARSDRRMKVADLRAGQYAADTRAADSGLKAHTSIALDLPDDLDQRAAGAVAEAGGRRAELAADLEKVKSSPDKKLAAEYSPVYQYALDNLPRLQAGAEGWRKMKIAEDAAAEKAGLSPSSQKRMQAIHDDPLSPESTLYPDNGFGTVPGFKKVADALAAGVDPKSSRLPDLARHYVEANRQAINQANFLRTASAMKASDGKSLLAPIEDSESRLNLDGSVTPTAKVPRGYEAVQAGPNTLAVHKEFAPVFKAMYGESAVRQNAVTNALLKTAGFAKKNTLVFETYHLFRLGASAGLGYGMIDYRDGLAAAKYRLEDLDRAVAAGALTEGQAKSVRDSSALDDKLLRAGLPVGKYADLMREQSHGLLDHVPVVGPAAAKFNRWMFDDVQRSYIRQAGRIAFERNQHRFPELSEPELLRRSVKEVADFFGDPAHTSIFSSKTMQDVANIIGFSPRWTEGKLKSELGGFVQAAKIPVDLLRGRGLRVGNVAQALGTLLLGSLVGTQLLNLLTRGKLTFQNPEEDHKWDAFIPGGPHGFFFSPLSIGAEFTHGLHKYMAGGENALDATAHIAGNKLSAVGRGAKDLLTGKDWRGQPFGSLGERVKAAAVDTLPSPLPLSGVLKKDPKALLGYDLNHDKGSLVKQAASAVGLKLDNAQSPRSQMYALAESTRAKHGGERPPGEYSGLRHALDNEDKTGTQDAIRSLLQDGKTLAQIAKALGYTKEGQSLKYDRFTGGTEQAEEAFFAKLTPEQKTVYRQARKDQEAALGLFKKYNEQLLREDPEARRMAALNSARAQQQRDAARQTPVVPPSAAPGQRRRFAGRAGSTNARVLDALRAVPGVQ